MIKKSFITYFPNRGIISFFLIMNLLSGCHAQESLKVYDYWSYYGDMSNVLYKHLCEIAFEQLDKRHTKIMKLKTKEDWKIRQIEVQTILKNAFGEFPEKTPLNPVITGKISRKDVVVEKIYFESRPGYYVTSALFIPTHTKGKNPAVLFCSGHSSKGFRSDAYQQIILNLVHKGFVVFAFDPVGQGERNQYFNEEGKKRFGPTIEHSYPGTQCFLTGFPPANYFIWDGIRAIDYLVGRTEVDASRIGITGRSGGGTQSAYIAAFDDRVYAAAPECYFTDFDKLLRSRGPQDAEQIPMYAIREGLDLSDLIEVRAPKPLLMVTTTRDIFSIQGARDVFHEAQSIYQAFGLTEHLIMVEDDEGHVSTKQNRESLYAFFQKHLSNPENPEDVQVSLFDEKELWITPKGHLKDFLPSETLFTLNEKYANILLNDLHKERNNPFTFINTLPDKIKELTGYQKKRLKTKSIFSGRIWNENYAIEKYLVKGTESYYLPLLRLLPKEKPKGTILFLHENGKEIAIRETWVDSLTKKGYEIILPDLTGIGELGGGYKGGDSRIQGIPLNVWYAGVLTGKTPLGIRMEDLDAVVGFIKKLNTYQGEITGVAYGTLGSDLLHSAVMNRNYDKIALINPLKSFSSLVTEKNYCTKFIMSTPSGVIGKYDLQDLIAALTNAKVLIVNPVNALDEDINIDPYSSSYSFAKQIFKDVGKSDNLTIMKSSIHPFTEIKEWMK